MFNAKKERKGKEDGVVKSTSDTNEKWQGAAQVRGKAKTNHNFQMGN